MTQEGKEVAVATLGVVFFTWLFYHWFHVDTPQSNTPPNETVFPIGEIPSLPSGVVSLSSIPVPSTNQSDDCSCDNCTTNPNNIPSSIADMQATFNATLAQIEAMGNQTLQIIAQNSNLSDPLLKVTVG